MIGSRLKKLIAENIKETRELRKVISKDGAEKIRKYDELTKALKVLSGILTIKTARSYDDNGNPTITVMYKADIPPQAVNITEENEIKTTEIFKAINYLNLISFQDMGRLSREIKDVSQQVIVEKYDKK